MNFQNLAKIERADTYLDIAFNAAKRKAEEEKRRKLKGIQKKRALETRRVVVSGGDLMKRLQGLLEVFPSVDQLPEFYQRMVEATMDYASLKKSLSRIKWAAGKLQKLVSYYESQIQKSNSTEEIQSLRKAYYGRVSSVMAGIDSALVYLDEARRVMRGYPNIKTGIFTVAICGFPNIGKTTLLSHLTSADPEINSYSFTTRGINSGYIRDGKKKAVQLLDTPGTLNRFERMNYIEKQAYIAMHYAADMYIYVFDLTEPYPLEQQQRLYESLGDKETLVYLSKTDILAEETIETFKKGLDAPAIQSPQEIDRILREKADEYAPREEEHGEGDSEAEDASDLGET